MIYQVAGVLFLIHYTRRKKFEKHVLNGKPFTTSMFTYLHTIVQTVRVEHMSKYMATHCLIMLGFVHTCLIVLFIMYKLNTKCLKVSKNMFCFSEKKIKRGRGVFFMHTMNRQKLYKRDESVCES